jgi:hypothetical protein
MTRKRMSASIKEALDHQGLPVTEESKAVADAAVDAALSYLLSFAQDVSEELVGNQLYSEAMVAGVFTRKLKALKTDDLTQNP